MEKKKKEKLVEKTAPAPAKKAVRKPVIEAEEETLRHYQGKPKKSVKSASKAQKAVRKSEIKAEEEASSQHSGKPKKSAKPASKAQKALHKPLKPHSEKPTRSTPSKKAQHKSTPRLKTNYILDTNIVISDPDAIFSFGKDNVILPMTVIEEAENLKKGNEDRNRAARLFLRLIKEMLDVECFNPKSSRKRKAQRDDADTLGFAERDEENFKTHYLNFELKEGGSIKICPVRQQDVRVENFPAEIKDHEILDLAIDISNRSGHVVLVTGDTALAVKAAFFGIKVQEYHGVKAPVRERPYQGICEVKVSQEELARISQVSNSLFESKELDRHTNCTMFALRCQEGDEPVLCRRVGQRYRKVPSKPFVSGISAKNLEQKFALDALLDPDLTCVALTGVAGSGKTLLTLAVALELMQGRSYDQVLIARPMVELSANTMGCLPGDVKEKIDPYFGPIYDNLEFLRAKRRKKGKNKGCGQHAGSQADAPKESEQVIKLWAQEQGIEFFALNFIRGRSFPCRLLIIDEAQNTSHKEIKTILTRLGEDSKVILLGDVSQIDLPYLTERNNGLSVVSESFRGRTCFAHIHLKTGERSDFASLATELL